VSVAEPILPGGIRRQFATYSIASTPQGHCRRTESQLLGVVAGVRGPRALGVGRLAMASSMSAAAPPDGDIPAKPDQPSSVSASTASISWRDLSCIRRALDRGLIRPSEAAEFDVPDLVDAREQCRGCPVARLHDMASPWGQTQSSATCRR
jgi:hypothetical protein